MSVQGLPLAFVKTHPVAGTQLSFVQVFLSSHTVAGPPAQVPVPLHLSPVVQALPSSQLTVLLVWVQPVRDEQPSVVQTLPSSQLAAAPPLQVPVASHLSPVVQASPSLHDWPLRGLGLHELLGSSQTPELHWLPDPEQSRATPATHVPAALHLSLTVQNRPSSQPLPFGSLALQLLPASLQLSAQLPSPSGPGQGLPVCKVHAPAAHTSAPLQKVPSSHAVPVWFVQVPGEAPLHVTQSSGFPPPQAVVQHTVSTQVVPPWHIVFREQEPPGAFTV